MARDDPRKPVKKPRQDIRNDKRPIPQEHHSSRGDPPRNSGNFTRGSQLLNTQILMWLQGARMPLYLWLGLFLLAYTIILSVTLDENNVQLICMRILSSLWDWISFDEMKRINLRLPNNNVRSTFMGYVPFVPEVILAWSKAVKGLLASLVIATGITLPLSIWYVEFSAKRGKAMIQERHERGAMLVERNLLYSEIAAHNKVEFVKEAARLFPDKKPEQVLKLPFKARKLGGIHHPYSVAGIPFPYALNMHMAQGITVNKAITVMQSWERNLSNQRLFNVGVTRIRFDLTMVVDNQQKLEMQIDKNPGDKTSSLESLGRLDIDRAVLQTKAADDALTKAMDSLDQAGSEKILIDPASLDMTDLPPMGASTTDYSDIRNLDGEMPSMKDRDDADRRDGRADKKDDELGLTPREHDDLSALPAMPGHAEQIRGLPEKNLSLDM